MVAEWDDHPSRWPVPVPLADVPVALVSTRETDLDDLKALNANLRRHGVDPLVDDRAALALADANLHAAVLGTGDYLVSVARKLHGT